MARRRSPKVFARAEEVETARALSAHPTNGRRLAPGKAPPPAPLPLPAAPESNVRITTKGLARDTVITDFFRPTRKERAEASGPYSGAPFLREATSKQVSDELL